METSSRAPKMAYVSGPINGVNTLYMIENCRRAAQLAIRLSRAGFAVVCVHTLAYFEILEAGGDAKGERLKQVLEQDLELLRYCDVVVLVTEDYSASSGTKLEVEEARKFEIPVMTEAEAIEALRSGKLDEEPSFRCEKCGNAEGEWIVPGNAELVALCTPCVKSLGLEILETEPDPCAS